MHRKCLDSNDEFNFYSIFTDDWNYNYLLLEPNSDIYNNFKPFKESSYNGMKHNILIYFKELLKLVNDKNLINADVKTWIFKKAFHEPNKRNYYDILSIFGHLLKYYIENYNRNEPINYKEFRKYFQTNKFLYQLTEEQEQNIHYNEHDEFRGNKTFYYLMGQMNKIITNDEEIKNKIEVMLAYLHFNDIFRFASGIHKLA
jgi:hypothetical protein